MDSVIGFFVIGAQEHYRMRETSVELSLQPNQVFFRTDALPSLE